MKTKNIQKDFKLINCANYGLQNYETHKYLTCWFNQLNKETKKEFVLNSIKFEISKHNSDEEYLFNAIFFFNTSSKSFWSKILYSFNKQQEYDNFIKYIEENDDYVADVKKAKKELKKFEKLATEHWNSLNFEERKTFDEEYNKILKRNFKSEICELKENFINLIKEYEQKDSKKDSYVLEAEMKKALSQLQLYRILSPDEVFVYNNCLIDQKHFKEEKKNNSDEEINKIYFDSVLIKIADCKKRIEQKIVNQ